MLPCIFALDFFSPSSSPSHCSFLSCCLLFSPLGLSQENLPSLLTHFPPLVCRLPSLPSRSYQQLLHHHPLSHSSPLKFSLSPDTFSRNSRRLFLTFLLSSKRLRNQLAFISEQGGCHATAVFSDRAGNPELPVGDGSTATDSPPGPRQATCPLSSPSFKIGVIIVHLPHMGVVKI